jgi:hypothetical protein
LKTSTDKKLEASTDFLVPNLLSGLNVFVGFKSCQIRYGLYDHPVFPIQPIEAQLNATWPNIIVGDKLYDFWLVFKTNLFIFK